MKFLSGLIFALSLSVTALANTRTETSFACQNGSEIKVRIEIESLLPKKAESLHSCQRDEAGAPEVCLDFLVIQKAFKTVWTIHSSLPGVGSLTKTIFADVMMPSQSNGYTFLTSNLGFSLSTGTTHFWVNAHFSPKTHATFEERGWILNELEVEDISFNATDTNQNILCSKN